MTGDHQLRAVDARFAMPVLARRAAVLGDLPAWREGLGAAGVAVVEPGEAEMVVSSVARAKEALYTNLPAVIVGSARARRSAGRAVVPLRSVPSTQPRVLLPLRHGMAVAYAVVNLLDDGRAGTRLRNRALARAARRLSARPLLRPHSLLYVDAGTEPALLHAARAAGVALGGEWCLVLSSGHTERKCAFLVIDRSGRPRHVIKFRRLPGGRQEFDRSAAALDTVAAAHPVVSRMAPSLIARFEHGGHPVVVESAVDGRPLQRLLASPAGGSRKHQAVDRVAAWLTEVGRATVARQPEALLGLSVFEHGDVWEENVFVGQDGGLRLIDWDRCRVAGRPLWDLLYYSMHVLPTLHGARGQDERLHLALAAARGEGEAGARLRRWIEDYAAAVGMPLDHVGRLASEGWRAWLAEYRQPEAAEGWFVPRLARAWQEDPALGERWQSWQGRYSGA